MDAQKISNAEELHQELKMAAATASMSDTGRTRNVMLTESQLPSLIPSGSLVRVRSLKLSDLRCGDIVCVREGKRFTVRRFVKTKMTRSHTLLLTAREGFDEKEAFSKNLLLGKVELVQHGGESFEPRSTESFSQKLLGRLTEYGTSRPFGFFSQS